MAEINRSINIFLNEAEVSASLEKMQAKAEVLRDKMTKAANPQEWDKLNAQLTTTTGKIEQFSRQLSGDANPTLRQMEATITRLRNELKNTETGTQDFINKTKQLAQAEQALKRVNTEVAGVKNAINEATKSTGLFTGMKDKLLEFARTLPGIGQAFSAMLGPVGLIVGAISALIGLLMQNAEVADEISFAFAGLKKVVRGLADDLWNLIKNGFEKLKTAIENPKEALKELGQVIVDNILNRFKALGMAMEAFTEGNFKKMGAALLQFATGVEDVGGKLAQFGGHIKTLYTEGDAAARKLDELTTAAARLKQAIAQTQIEIEKQTTLTKDATKTDEERLKAAEKVIALETANANRRIKIISLELQAIEERNRGIELSGEEEAKVLELQTAKLQEEANKQAAIRKATNLKAQLEAELAAKRMKDLAVVEVNTITEVVNKANGLVGDFAKRTVESVKNKWGEFRDFISGEWGQAIQAGVQTVNNLISGSIQISDNLTEKKLQDIGKVFTKQQEELDRQRELNLISEEAYALKSEAIKKDQARKEAQLKREAFIKQKAANITMAVINTALSVVNALATAPWPVNIVMAALAAAAGAVQIGVIASQPIPQFAKGGKLAGPRHAEGGIPVHVGGRVVAEAEGDEWIVNRQSSHKYHHALDAINRDDASVHWLRGFPRLNMPYAIANGQIMLDGNGMPMRSSDEGLRNEIKKGHKLQIQAAKYIATEITAAIREQNTRKRL